MLDEKEEDKSFFSQHEFSCSLVIFIIFLAILILFFGGRVTIINTCGDGSTYGSCSETKPYYCDSGFLVEKASICGCDNLSGPDGDSCISQYQAEPKKITLDYLLDGEAKSLDFTVYGELTDHLADESRVISYQKGQDPTRADFELKILNNEQQRQSLLPLVIAIQNLTNNKVDQARIAINLVQKVPYGFSNETDIFFGQKINHSRYPYEVLHDSEGICGEKSDLLAFLLRELGFGTAIFYNQKENHQSVGIECPLEESHEGTGYCFVETTGPAIISDDSIEYVGGVFLESEPEVIVVSEGMSLPYGLPEYRDAEIMKAIREGKLFFLKKFELNRLKNKYGLVEEYNLA